jgi:hypothetical protein
MRFTVTISPPFRTRRTKSFNRAAPPAAKVFYTVNQFITHLSDDVLPPLLDRPSSEKNG